MRVAIRDTGTDPGLCGHSFRGVKSRGLIICSNLEQDLFDLGISWSPRRLDREIKPREIGRY